MRHYNPQFYLIFHCGLYWTAVNITDNSSAKNGISFFLSLKSAVYTQDPLYTRVVSYQERVVVVRTQYIFDQERTW